MQPVNDVAIQAIPYIASIFCVTAMFAMGLDVTFDQFILPLRNLRVLAVIILANQILLPFMVLLIILLPNVLTEENILDTIIDAVLTYTPNQYSGLLLMAMAAGTFTAPMWAQMARSNIRLAHGTMAILVLASAVLLPFEIRVLQLLSIFEGDVLDKLVIRELYGTILLYQLLPLGIGIAIKGWYDAIALRLRPLIIQFTGLAFLVLLAAMLMTGNPYVRMPNTPLSENEHLFDLPFDASISPSLNDGMVPQSLRDGFNAKEIALPNDTTVLMLDPTNRWQLLDRTERKLYLVTRAGQTITVNGYTNFQSYLDESVTSDEFFARLKAGYIPFQLTNGFALHGITPDEESTATPVAGEDGQWMITVGESVFLGQREGNQLSVTEQAADEDAEPLLVVDATATQREFFSVLNHGFVPLTLQAAMTDEIATVDGKRKAEAGGNPNTWRFAADEKRFTVRRNGDGVAIHEVLSSPITLVTDFLANLETPVVPAVIGAFLQAFVALTLPLIFYLIMSIVFLTVGYFSGIFAQSILNMSGTAIPRTLATTTAVRNLSMVVIIVVNHLQAEMTDSAGNRFTGVDLGVLAAVLTIFIMNLIVAAYNADRWQRAPGTAEQDLATLTADKDELAGKIKPAASAAG